MVLTDLEYRALPRESFSSLKYILESPETFLYYKQKPFTGNNSSLLGTAVHHYLQGNKHLVVVNNIKRLSKAGKEEYAQFEADFRELAGDEGIIVPQSFEETLTAILNNYQDNSKAVKIVEGCEFEMPYFFTIDGVELKGKVDGVAHMVKNCSPYLLEIKTSSQATTVQEFRDEAKDRHYDMQAAMYLEAHRQEHGEELDHYFLVANTRAPFKVAIYRSTKDFLKEGKKKLHDALRRYTRYILNGEVYEEDIECL